MVFAINDDGMGPDDSKRPAGEVKIQITVPEEFAGVALGALGAAAPG